MNFEDVVVIVTGASKGIGHCLANILSQYGANVIGIYNNTKIKDTVFESYKCNIGSEKEIERLIKYVENKYGKIDVLINCAALCRDDDIYVKSGKDFLEVLNVNLVAPFLLCKYASKIMSKGVIINISSTDAQDTYDPYSMDYAASKAGLENLTKNLALRFPNLKVCALAPGWVNTETVSQMDPKYLKEALEKSGQKELLRKEDIAVKIIEMIINNDDYISGDIVRMDGRYE
ncbi:MAG: SDR family oxidoreductase [Firmicutes bacterium]|nr:SDR family oxidoreductase [Bacillota bacterium]